MVDVTNYYNVICDYEEFINYLSTLSSNTGMDTTSIDDPPSYPCLLDVFNRGGETNYQYTEVCDLEGATRKYYVDQDPEYSVLLDVAREMMFTNSRIEDSTKGV